MSSVSALKPTYFRTELLDDQIGKLYRGDDPLRATSVIPLRFLYVNIGKSILITLQS